MSRFRSKHININNSESPSLIAKTDSTGQNERAQAGLYTNCYALYNYNLKGESAQFYHLDFMAVLAWLSEGFLGEETAHELVKAFRRTERMVLFAKR